MEVMNGLEESGFKFVPKETVYDPMLKFSKSFCTTWGVEKAIGVEKTAARQSHNDKCGQKEMWQALQTSSLLKDLGHETPRPSLEQRQRSVVADLKGAFKSDLSQSKLEEEEYIKLATDSWFCPSPELFQNLGGNTEVLLAVQDAPERLEVNWMNFLLRPVCLVQLKSQPKHPWVVAYVWADGVLLWQLTPHTSKLSNGDLFRWLEFQTVDSSNIVLVNNVHDLDEIRVSDATIRSQEAVLSQFAGTHRESWPRGHVITPKGFKSMLSSSCDHAFDKMTMDHMKYLAVVPRLGLEFGLGNRMPKTEKPMVAMLARAIYPDATQERIDGIANMRESRAHKKAHPIPH